jgi:hypothetical protein
MHKRSTPSWPRELVELVGAVERTAVSMQNERSTVAARASLLRDFAERYIWWVDEHGPSDDRIIAQVMNIGTYEDIRRLERAYETKELRAAMLRAQPGWISARSWDFWRGRLSFAGAEPIPEEPPRRSFDAEVL